MRIFLHALQRVVGHCRHVVCIEQLQPFGGGFHRERGVAHFEVIRHVGEARLHAVQARISFQFGAAHRIEQTESLCIGVGRNADVAVFGRYRFGLRIEQARIAGAAERRLEGRQIHMLFEHELDEVLEHRNADRAAFAGFFAAIQRHDDHLHRNHADGFVGHHHRHVTWFAGGAVMQRRHAGRALNDGVVGGLVFIAAVLTEPVQTAIHDFRIDLLHVFVR